jgi:hypothetical protein
LKCTPFEALHGYPPPQIYEVMVPGPDSPAIDFIHNKQQMIVKLKDNLVHAQNRIKKFVDQNKSERKF